MEKDYTVGLHQDRNDRWELTVLLTAAGYAENRHLALIQLGRRRTEDEALAAADYTLTKRGWERTTDWNRTERRVGALFGGPTASYQADAEPRGRHTYTLNNGLYGACDCIGAMLSPWVLVVVATPQFKGCDGLRDPQGPNTAGP
jgi:hypothetical protein